MNVSPMRSMLTVIFVCCLLAQPFAYALDVPEPGKTDSRIRTVTYDPMDVVRVIGHIGYTTTIFFEQGETIESVPSESGEPISPVILGNTYAWSVLSIDNTLTLKPTVQKGERASTSLMVKTTKRFYTFELITGEHEGVTTHPNPPGMMLQIRFSYPKEATTVVPSEVAFPKNYLYSAKGNTENLPYEVWDDGLQTRMRFYQQQGVPAPFIVGSDGKEAMTAYHMESNKTLVIHGVYKQILLRHGDQRVCIFRETPLDETVPTSSGTTSPDTIRERRK